MIISCDPSTESVAALFGLLGAFGLAILKKLSDPKPGPKSQKRRKGKVRRQS